MTIRKVIFSIFIMICVSANGYAFNEDLVTIPSFNIVLNKKAINNNDRVYPFLMYKDITYMPLSWDITQFMGIKTIYNKSASYDKDIMYIGNSNSRTELFNPVELSVGDILYDNKVQQVPYEVYVNDVGCPINNDIEEYPILNFKGVTYIPLTYRLSVEVFDWDYYFDSEKGLFIDSTDVCRPEYDYTFLFGKNFMHNPTIHATFQELYVGYQSSRAVGDNTSLFFLKRRGQEEICIDLTAEMQRISKEYGYAGINVNRAFNDKDGYGVGYPEKLNGNTLTIYATTDKVNVKDDKTNLMLSINLDTFIIENVEEIPLVPYLYHSQASEYQKRFS